MSNLLGQQNGLAGLTGGMNNSLGNFGATLGGANFGGNLGLTSSNFGAPAGGNPNTAALLQQLIAQQNGGGGANINQAAGAPWAQGAGGSGDNATFGNKRSISDVSGGGGGEEDGGPSKKQQTVSL